jgi:hypothetical protein
MSGDTGVQPYTRFGLLVTGRGERQILPSLFRSLAAAYPCYFEVIGKIEQLQPRTSAKKSKKLRGLGQDNGLPTRDEEIGLIARRFLNQYPASYVLLIDDLEYRRAEHHQEVFVRYRNAFDRMLGSSQARRASVHFLVMMLEAYYFAHAEAVNSVFGTDLEDYPEDVEGIRHPKNRLKNLLKQHGVRFKEITHGRSIVANLDLEKVLANPGTCASLRTIFAWCVKALRADAEEKRFALDSGITSKVTDHQIANVKPGP